MIPRTTHVYHEQGVRHLQVHFPKFAGFRANLCGLHPGWTHLLWSEPSGRQIVEEVFGQSVSVWELCHNSSQRGDLVKWAAMELYGGVFLDTDMDLLQPLDPLLSLPGFLPGSTDQGQVIAACCIGGFPKEHEFTRQMLQEIPPFLESTMDRVQQVRMGVLPHRVWVKAGGRDVVLLPPGVLHPFPCSEARKPESKLMIRPDSIAYHDHGASWALPHIMHLLAELSAENSGGIYQAGTDKDTAHSYGLVYRSIFDRLLALQRPLHILEIGVASGASLLVWRRFLDGRMSDSTVTGVDVDLTHVMQSVLESGILLLELDSVTDDIPGTYDLIIDDGSHALADQSTTKERLWPQVNFGGCYVVEDIVIVPDLSSLDLGTEDTLLDLRHERPGREDNVLHVGWKAVDNLALETDE